MSIILHQVFLLTHILSSVGKHFKPISFGLLVLHENHICNPLPPLTIQLSFSFNCFSFSVKGGSTLFYFLNTIFFNLCLFCRGSLRVLISAFCEPSNSLILTLEDQFLFALTLNGVFFCYANPNTGSTRLGCAKFM